jgi:simple sugar transport system permease protein
MAAIILWFIIFRSRWGYEIRLIGDNPQAAKYAGINITKNIVWVMMLSGALAGLGGMSEVTGVVHRLQTAPIAAGYGFTGIIVAWLAKLNPLVIIVASILFGALILAGREIQPSGVPKMIQGIILVCLIASDFLLRYRIVIERGEE